MAGVDCIILAFMSIEVVLVDTDKDEDTAEEPGETETEEQELARGEAELFCEDIVQISVCVCLSLFALGGQLSSACTDIS